MGDFSDLIREGVGIIDDMTKNDLQVAVGVARWLAQNVLGAPTFGATTSVQAFVDYDQGVIRTADGKEVRYKAWVMFPRPQLLALKDKIILPNGTTGPILNTNGFVDSATGESYYREVYLG